MLPAPFRHYDLAHYGGQLADAHVLVKYAVRFKDAGEMTGVRAYPLAAATVNELLESQPLSPAEADLLTEAPAGLRYGDLPGWLASAGARGVEKALKDRLADKLAKRLEAAGGGGAAGKLREKLEKKKRDLALREQDLSGRKREKLAAVGTALLSGVARLFGGRKRGLASAISSSVGRAGSVLSKNRMENTAEARVEALQAEIAGLEAELAALTAIDPARFEETQLVPARSAVKLLRCELVWVY